VRAISTDIIRRMIVQHCRTSDLELTATCRIKLRLSLLLNQDLKLVCFLLLSANYSIYLFRQRLFSRLTALRRYINYYYYYYYYYYCQLRATSRLMWASVREYVFYVFFPFKNTTFNKVF